jgi:hypothetical protein
MRSIANRLSRLSGFCFVALCCTVLLANGPGGPIAPPWQIWNQHVGANPWDLDVTCETPLNTAGTYEVYENWTTPAPENAPQRTKKATWNIVASPTAGNHQKVISRPANMAKAGGLSTCEGELKDLANAIQAGPLSFTW